MNTEFENLSVLTNKLLETEPDNIEALVQLLQVAKLNDEPYVKEQLLRKLLELNPNNLEYKVDLAKALMKQYNRENRKKDYLIARESSKLLDVKRLLFEVYKFEPENLQTIIFLRRLAYLQGDIKNELKYIRLLLFYNPEDKEAFKAYKNIEAYRARRYIKRFE